MSAFSFRPQLESLSERVVPDSSPPALGQAEALLVAKQGELTGLAEAVDVKAEAVVRAEAADNETEVQSYLTQFNAAFDTFVDVEAAYVETRADYDAAASRAGHAAPAAVAGFDLAAVSALVDADLGRVSLLVMPISTASSVGAPGGREGETVVVPPATPAPPPAVVPRKFEDFTAPAEMTDEELDSWDEWLDEEVADYERYIKHLQARIVLRNADLVRLARAVNAATTQEEHNKLAMEHLRIGLLLDDARDELREAVETQDRLKAARKQVQAELEWRDLINP